MCTIAILSTCRDTFYCTPCPLNKEALTGRRWVIAACHEMFLLHCWAVSLKYLKFICHLSSPFIINVLLSFVVGLIGGRVQMSCLHPFCFRLWHLLRLCVGGSG